MHAKKEERTVQALFADLFGLDLRKRPESSAKSPDFDVYAGAQQIGVLEVKALTTTDVALQDMPAPTCFIGGLDDDNCTDRVERKLHQAVSQLDGFEVPRILVFFNCYTEADKFDLLEVLRGYLVFGDQRCTTLAAGALRRAYHDRARVDLCLWVEADSDERPAIVSTTARGSAFRQAYLQRITGPEASSTTAPV
ncbi:MAG TPA: hypothetical protein VJU61_02565 [Polyangiaceae bacterium]|nr:hypothetical protein [Polyangiaceae bacterium]